MFRRALRLQCTAFKVPHPTNEKMLEYREGSIERQKLLDAIVRVKSKKWDIPCIVNGEEIRCGTAKTRVIPSDHSSALCSYYLATPEVLQKAVKASLDAQEVWSRFQFHDRAAILLRAAHLLSTVYRYDILAATILGQSKNVWQAEIDAAAELCDFLRFNCLYAEEIYYRQPMSPSDSSVWNYMDYRPLEGFVLAISPFNFTAIGGNLATAPALMGNTVVWKPSETSILSNYLTFKLLEEAGMPPGVINFVPAAPADVNANVTAHPKLGGIAFTGSTRTFQSIWKFVANNLENYQSLPRLVGECGGKNFHLVHNSAHCDEVVACTIRSAFEYQGQKCSACSRMYIPASLYDKIVPHLIEEAKRVVVGQPSNMRTMCAAMIDETSFKKVSAKIEDAKKDPNCKLLCGGNPDDSIGWFIPPTIFEVKDPKHWIMKEELFGPVLAFYVYEDKDWNSVLQLVNDNPYSLSGSLFCLDRRVTVAASNTLRQACGNFFINDKSTGSIVGQQPFGGSRASGTNDKAGFSHFLHRWISVRSVKETFSKLTEIEYPHQRYPSA